MSLKFRAGKLAKSIAMKKHTIVPYSETIQHIVITKLPDGTMAEGTDYITAEKERLLEQLRNKYGEIDESQITWIMVNNAGTKKQMV